VVLHVLQAKVLTALLLPLFYYFAVLGLEFRASRFLGRHSTNGLYFILKWTALEDRDVFLQSKEQSCLLPIIKDLGS
jgi:hypothetical protein